MSSSLRKCQKSGNHAGRPIEAFCLEEDCKRNRLLCFYCVFESHKDHQIAYLHKELEGPISNLHSSLPDSTQGDHLIAITDHLHHMNKTVDSIGKTATAKLKAIQTHLRPQLQAIEALKKDQSEDIIKDLSTNAKQINNDKLEKYAALLRLHVDGGEIDYEHLKEKWDRIREDFDEHVSRATAQIECIIDDIIAKVNQINGKPQQAKEKVENSCFMVKAEEKDSVNQEMEEERDVPEEKPQPECSAESAMQPEPNPVEEVKESTMHAEIVAALRTGEEDKDQEKGKQGKSMSRIGRHQSLEMKMQRRSYRIQDNSEKKNGIPEGMEGENHHEDSYESLLGEVEGKQDWQPDGSKRKEEMPISVTYNTRPSDERKTKPSYDVEPMVESEVETVQVLVDYPSQVPRQLAKIHPKVVTDLTVMCVNKLCALNHESVQLIAQMTNLRALRVNWARGLPVEQAVEMLSGLSNLKELCLSEFSDVEDNFLNCIRSNNTKLRRLYLTLDFTRCLRMLEEYLEFTNDMAKSYVMENDWYEMAKQLELINLELHDPVDLKFWVKFIRERRGFLRQVTIMEHEDKSGFDYSPIIAELSHCRKIEGLRLESIEFDENELVGLIKANPGLRSFVSSECRISDKTICALKQNCRRLRQLELSLIDGPTGKNMFKFPCLQHLIIRGVWNFGDSIFERNIPKLHNLRCLAMDFNETWVKPSCFKLLSSLKHLRVLNINNNKLSIEVLSCLDALPRLHTLICSNNSLTIRAVSNYGFSTRLRKLAISAESPNQTLGRVGTHFPRLTHLKLTSCRSIEPSDLNAFGSLKSITLPDYDEEGKKYLQEFCEERDINVNVTETVD